jgi:hypothetical protein
MAREARGARDVRPLILGGLTLLLVGQLMIDGSGSNIAASLMALASTVLTMLYVARPTLWAQTPLSTLTVLGFNLTTQGGALAVQTLSGRSLVYNLRVPVETFGTLAIAQLVIILVHFAYTRGMFQELRGVVSNRIYRPVGLLSMPSDLQLWILGMVGCVAIWVTNVDLRGAIQYGDAGLKLVQGFTPFVLAPFLIPFQRYNAGADSGQRIVWPLLIGYFGLLVFLGVARNSRTTFFSAMISVALIFGLYLFARNIRLTRKLKVRLAALALILFPLMAVLSDLAIAMVNVRSERVRVSGVELALSTLSALGDRDAIAARRERDALAVSGYNESYFMSPVMGRLIVTKYHDNVMFVAVNATPSVVERGRQELALRTTLILPTPVLDLLGVEIDKGRHMYSSGDLYLSMVEDRTRGSFVVGSAVADALIIAGWGWVAVLGGVALASFILLDAFCLHRGGSLLLIAPMGALSAYTAFALLLVSESVAVQLAWLLRGLPQLAVLYLVVFHLTHAFGARGQPRSMAAAVRR